MLPKFALAALVVAGSDAAGLVAVGEAVLVVELVEVSTSVVVLRLTESVDTGSDVTETSVVTVVEVVGIGTMVTGVPETVVTMGTAVITVPISL
jgi:hypothetical protein